MQTTTKGMLGVTACITDLLKQGRSEILVPYDSASPYDLVVVHAGKFYRVQVKYRALKNGSIYAPIRRASIGSRRRTLWRDNTEVDVICLYCPQTDACYYTRPRKNLTLRIVSSKNGQKRFIRQAEAFRTFPPEA